MNLAIVGYGKMGRMLDHLRIDSSTATEALGEESFMGLDPEVFA